MSEYWKSTPKYWCKHCKAYVRDTKFERTQHEATPRHQGNIKRFVRDLHRGNEREQRQKQRAKDEVERLNGIVAGSSSKSESGSSRQIPAGPSSVGTTVTPAERKAWISQLAALGVAVPEEYRGGMAMAGDWKTVSQRSIYEPVKKEEEDDNIDKKLDLHNLETRKRKLDGIEEDRAATHKRIVKRNWGSALRDYPTEDANDDLDALLERTATSMAVKTEPTTTPHSHETDAPEKFPVDKVKEEPDDSDTKTQIKREEALYEMNIIPQTNPKEEDDEKGAIKQEAEPVVESFVAFKKRKPKPKRNGTLVS